MRAAEVVPAPPISPGQVLRKRILTDNLTQERLADAMRVSRFTINQIVNGRRAITAEMALRLARVTSTTAGFWLTLQQEVDLYRARLKLDAEVEQLEVLRPPKSEGELFANRATPSSND